MEVVEGIQFQIRTKPTNLRGYHHSKEYCRNVDKNSPSRKKTWNQESLSHHDTAQVFFFFFFEETNTHIRKRERDSNIKIYHNSIQKS